LRGYPSRRRRSPSLLVIVGGFAAAVLVVGLGYLGVQAVWGDDDASTLTTLPELTTTSTSTTTPVTTTTQAVFYEVQRGDTLFLISEKFGVRMDDLIALNEIENPDDIQAGQVLQIPPPTVLVSEPPPSSLALTTTTSA
jgi:LysM repeat protein